MLQWRPPSPLLRAVARLRVSLIVCGVAVGAPSADSRIKENAEVEYHYQRFLHIFEYTHVVPAVPPPFSTPWRIFDLLDDVRGLCARCSGGGGGSGARESAAEALHRVAAARPAVWDAHGPHGSLSLSKKYAVKGKRSTGPHRKPSCTPTADVAKAPPQVRAGIPQDRHRRLSQQQHVGGHAQAG